MAFPEVKKKLGFGCMRLPKIEEEEIRPVFESQLETCGVEYFNFYLMHAMHKERFETYKKARAFETAFALKEEGKIKHLGMSFHDRPEVLDEILTAYPDLEFVQIQFNYLDYENPVVQSREVYEVCRKHDKPIIIMEPIKGGQLVHLSDQAQELFDGLENQATNASIALRYAAEQEGVFMVLSGMSNLDQMKENTETFKDLQDLSEEEEEAVKEVRSIMENENRIACTACRYCVDSCPQNILIPDLFMCYNDIKVYNNWMSMVGPRYEDHTKENGKASDCIKCGVCESQCPQFLPVRDLLEDVAELFETEEEAD